MRILAIETSCDETAVAVIEVEPPPEVQPEVQPPETQEKIRVLANVISSQVKLHAQYGGVVPALAAREHAANIGHVFNAALEQSGITDPERDIDLLAVTRGPGLGPALLVGLMFARTLAWRWDKPLVGVNHMDGHVHSNWLTSTFAIRTSEIFPALNLIVSGGHTELVLMRGHGDYDIIGETRDDAIGEAFDKVARLLDLGYPGGPAIAKLALTGNPDAYPLPRPMAASDDYDFSYSGLKTAVLYLIRDLGGSLSDQQKADIAASFQHAAIDVLLTKTERAAREHAVKAILLSGGVSANTLLRERLHQLATELGVRYLCPEMKYTTDNAAMIAVAGYFAYQKEKTAPSREAVGMDANLRLSA